MRLNKSKERIGKMFDEIAGRYDFLNHFFTANLDKRWRKKIIKQIEYFNFPYETVVDMASGTGDMMAALLKLGPKKAYSFDISEKMLDVQRVKIKDDRLKIQKADSENIPLEDNSVNILTVAFGVRNFENLEKSILEVKRVLKPKGTFIVLEMFSMEKRNIFFEFYFTRIMPLFGKLVSRSSYAYDYLHNSVMKFKTVKEFADLAEKNGFTLRKSENNFMKFVYTVYLEKK
ncbi:MAG: ubiquinone/menaquinone biosynthesis methyltransferase [Ignavibacteria bacterium]|nr:ubiquinone/menaquinone biosynthesis methyltransferase [Ignavibacteria bacterium]